MPGQRYTKRMKGGDDVKKVKVSSPPSSPDITKRKQVEEALRESEGKLRLMFESITDGITVTDLNGIIIEANERTAQMHGTGSNDELLGKSAFEFFAPHNRELAAMNMRKTLEQGLVRDIEYTLLKADGSEFPGELSASVMRDASGNPIGFIAITRDITERKRMEHALNERVKELQCLYDIAYIAERPGIALDELCQEVVNLLPAAWQYPEITCARVTLGDKEFRTDNFKTTEWKQSANINVKEQKEGTIEVYYLEARPEIGEGPFAKEERLLMDVVAERLGRITERKRVEEELRVKDMAITSSITATAMADLEGNVTYVNHAFLRMWGYDDEKEILGKSAVEFWQVAEEAVRVMQVAMDREGWIGELTAKRKDGSKFDVQLSASVVRDEAGKFICRFGSFIDITERKRAECELQEKNEQLDIQNEELQSQTEELMTQQQELIEKTGEVERANQLKSEFLANMSHGLRTPLNAILGFSELMIDEVPGKINEKQRQCLSDILASSQHLLNLINKVLDLSKIESGRTKLNLTNLALTEVIESLARTMLPILAPRQQSLDVEIEEGLPLVHADKAKLKEVLFNLLSNAAKFTPDGGKLKIEAVREGDWCRVSVIDNGIGIKEEDQEQIFEPFHQLDNPLTKEKSGTGLGLALVKQIIEKHDGQIRVESEYEKGSRFTFTLPLATTD